MHGFSFDVHVHSSYTVPVYKLCSCMEKEVVVMEQNKNTISEDLLGVMSGNVGSVCTIV